MQSHETPSAVERYYSTKELAGLLSTTPGTIQQWRRGGKAPEATRINGAVRYSATAVNEWIAAQNEPAETPAHAQQQNTGQLVGTHA